MFAKLLAIAVILKCSFSQNEAPEECRWISFGGLGPLNQQYAMQVCREVVTNGATEYKMWTCNGHLPIEQTYDNDECRGNPTNEATAANAEHSCVNGTVEPLGPCNYFMIKRPCNDDMNFETFPVIADDCTGNNFGFSWEWDCATNMYIEYEPSKVCDGSSGDTYPWSMSGFMDGCIDDNTDPFALNTAFQPLSLCLSVAYTPQPTVDPTTDPTMEPTTDPTSKPTEVSMTPTATPSEATEAPTSSPDEDTPESASFINIITNCIFVLFLVSFINFV